MCMPATISKLLIQSYLLVGTLSSIVEFELMGGSNIWIMPPLFHNCLSSGKPESLTFLCDNVYGTIGFNDKQLI